MANAVEIIQQSMAQQGFDASTIDKALSGVANIVKNPGAKLVHINNSVFLILVRGPGEVEVHTFSSETPQVLARNYIELAKYLKNIGVKVAKTYSDDPRFLQIAKMTRLPVKINDVSENANVKNRAYQYVLEM